MAYCRIIIAGNVGKDPEGRFSAAGKQIANFSIAVTDKHGQNENTTWFRCTAFDKTAEVILSYVKRGSMILVDGRIACRKYTSKEGIEKDSWEVTVDRMQLLGSKGQDAQAPARSAPSTPAASGGSGFDNMDDDIPF